MKAEILSSEPLARFLDGFRADGNRICLCPTIDKKAFTVRIYDEESQKGTMLLAHFGKSLKDDKGKIALSNAKKVIYDNPERYQVAHCANTDTGEEFATVCKPGSVEAVFVEPLDENDTADATVVE